MRAPQDKLVAPSLSHTHTHTHTLPLLPPPPPQSPYNTNLLMAGYDEGSGPALYWCDYLATLHHMNICGTGYGALAGGGQGASCAVGRG